MLQTLPRGASRLFAPNLPAGTGVDSAPARLAPTVENRPPPAPRLAALEGLRGYLALWVLVCHVMWSSGYDSNALWMVPKLIAKGRYAVEVFMIISGFVIFFLLDQRRENYKQFIVRRFFRIFPVFLLLFLLAIPGSQLLLWNTVHAPFLTTDHRNDVLQQIHSWWSNIEWHVPVHLLMIHGIVPSAILEHSATAFLGPAWSMSTEWQFYLIAPLAFALAASPRPFHRIGLCAACVCVYVAAKGAARVFPETDSDAALPLLVEFFFVGGASYFLYKRNAGKPFLDSAFPVFASLGIFLFVLGGTSRLQLTPLVIWLIFLGLILEHPGSFCSRALSPLFTHRWPQCLGRISYSLYLSHLLLISITQYVILKFAPDLSRLAHFGLLLAGTLVISIAVSLALYRYVEAPAMDLGKRLARRLVPKPGLSPSVQPAPCRKATYNAAVS
jgi:peptidoglycan/LPS O-acetylase OafA/YrhL